MREDIAFKNIMNLIGQYPYASEEEYNKGTNQCQELEQTVEQECSSLQLNLEELRKNADDLKKEYGGDILPALYYLGQFTYAKDPRICGNDIKRDYLVGVLLFTFTARDYLKMRIKEHKYEESILKKEGKHGS